jgi:hypothetical protein
MDYKLAAAVAIFVLASSGCVTPTQPRVNCTETGCPINVTSPPQETVCGDGAVQKPEECEVGFPCANGTFCQKCRCTAIVPGERVSDCPAECAKNGYNESKVVSEGSCIHATGLNSPCAVKCSYRKVFPAAEEGKVCCCTGVNYIPCPAGNATAGKCQCPGREEAANWCSAGSPGSESKVGLRD